MPSAPAGNGSDLHPANAPAAPLSTWFRPGQWVNPRMPSVDSSTVEMTSAPVSPGAIDDWPSCNVPSVMLSASTSSEIDKRANTGGNPPICNRLQKWSDTATMANFCFGGCLPGPYSVIRCCTSVASVSSIAERIRWNRTDIALANRSEPFDCAAPSGTDRVSLNCVSRSFSLSRISPCYLHA